jgi:hypothetical protein
MNPLLEGYLNTKLLPHGKWKHRFVVLDPHNLFIFKSPTVNKERVFYEYSHPKQDRKTPRQIPLLLATPKLLPQNRRFQIITRSDSYKLETKTEKELLMWTASIQDVCDSLTKLSIGNNEVYLIYSVFLTINLQLKSDKTELLALMKIPENQVCADCNAKGL